uniref:Potassium channel domain-containing protein n=1 Tax=Romanomermis culicivorax TaxID=13658 RepID=A0A915HR14_ROMCU
MFSNLKKDTNQSIVTIVQMKLLQQAFVDNRYGYVLELQYDRYTFPPIGYGNIACRTYLGKAVTICYAIIGVPLMLLFLTNIGDVFAKVFTFIYRKTLRWELGAKIWRKRQKLTRQKQRLDAFTATLGLTSAADDADNERRSLNKSSTAYFQKRQARQQQFLRIRDNLEAWGADETSFVGSSGSAASLRRTRHYANSCKTLSRNYNACGADNDQSGTWYDRLVATVGHMLRSAAWHGLPPDTQSKILKDRSCSKIRHFLLKFESDLRNPSEDCNLIQKCYQVSDDNERVITTIIGKRKGKCLLSYNCEKETHDKRSTESAPSFYFELDPQMSFAEQQHYFLIINRERKSIEKLAQGIRCLTVEIERTDARNVPLWLVLFTMIVYLMIGAVMFAVWEKWDFLDSFYFCFISLTTLSDEQSVIQDHKFVGILD